MRLWTISVKVSITEPTERCKMTGRLEASTILSIVINYTLYDMNTKSVKRKPCATQLVCLVKRACAVKYFGVSPAVTKIQ